MSYSVLEGQTRRFRRAGTLASSVSVTIPEGQFVKRTGNGDEYTVIDSTTPPVVFLNLVDSDRPDCTDGGVAVIGGEFYELSTDVYDSSATFVLHGEVSVKQVGSSASGILTASTSGDYVHGICVQVPASGNGNMLRVMMAATNLGVKS